MLNLFGWVFTSGKGGETSDGSKQTKLLQKDPVSTTLPNPSSGNKPEAHNDVQCGPIEELDVGDKPKIDEEKDKIGDKLIKSSLSSQLNHKTKRIRKAKSQKKPGFYEAEHLYVTEDDERPCDVAKRVKLDGGVEKLVELNTPYNGSILTMNSRLMRGTLLRVDDSIPVPGQYTYGDDENKGYGDDVGDEDDDVCSYCLQGHSSKGNKIVYCDGIGCSIKLHQKKCGGPSIIPKGKWLCEPCNAGFFQKHQMLPLSCKGCRKGSANIPWTLSGGQWMHMACVGNEIFSKQDVGRKKVEGSTNPSRDSKNVPGGFLKARLIDDLREDVWTTIMGEKTMRALCPVCGRNEINKDRGGFQAAHIDPTRKHDDHEAARTECWNLVPSCAQCNSICGHQNMFDFMAKTTTTRGKIHSIACKKLYAHFLQGFRSTDSPSIKDLYENLKPNGHIDFASLVRTSYNCKKMESDEGLGYRFLLELTEEQTARFSGLFNNVKAAKRYSAEDW